MLESFRILVLNSTYEPLQFCNAKRALVMVLTGRAEQLECDGYKVRTPSMIIPLPTVIRVLNRVKRTPRKSVAFSKKNILRRDNYTCQYCGEMEKNLTVDHIMPKSRGGKTVWNNVVVACKPCNLKKGNRTMVEAGLKLHKKPSKPDYYPYPQCIPTASQSHVQSWLKYLPKKLYDNSISN